MDTLPLPPRPSLEQYKKRAKDLVTAAKSKDPAAVRAWATEWLGTLANLLDIAITPFVQGSFDRAIGTIEKRVRDKIAPPQEGPRSFGLADAQFLIAQAHGFENWAEFANHLPCFFRRDAEGREFEAAVDAVVCGDLATLESALRKHPDLVRARSARVHRATLLHYVAANGIEDFRQRTPPNAVAIAGLLLEAGAEVDALANTYGGGKAQTTMNLLVSSTHPAEAGLQPALVEVLLDFGASINGLEDDGSPLMTALKFGYAEAAEILVRRGARVDNVVAAAGVGRLDLVKRLADGAAKEQLEKALIMAARYGTHDVLEYLLDRGVDVAASDGMTALHHATGRGDPDMIKLLIKRGAPLEKKNVYGGTVLANTLWFAYNVDASEFERRDFPTVLDTLIAAGARTDVYPEMQNHINDVYRRAGEKRRGTEDVPNS